MEQNMPKKRLSHYGMIVVLTVLISGFFVYQNGFAIDAALAYLIMDAVFLAVLLYMLESCRICGQLGESATNHYKKIAASYGFSCVCIACCSFLPAFSVPAASIALFFCISANFEIAVSCCIFLCILFCMAAGRSIYELSACVLLILIGAEMVRTMREKKYRLWGCMILVSVSLCIPALCCYLANYSASPVLFLWNALFSAAAACFYFFTADKRYDKIEYEYVNAYETIIKDNFPYVLDIKKYSKAEYVHAIKTATIARKCAAEIGEDELSAAAGGFYYRLGILEGEPFVENGVRLAQEGCFPAAVVQILAEYNGEKKLPSTKVSAIIHMVDACIKKIEMLNSQNLSSSWNQDMVIYQTLNELSASGIYDASGLSMNQFLKVRELLVREELGYDHHD